MSPKGAFVRIFNKRRTKMAITENKVEDMLMNTMFTDSAHKAAVRKRLQSGVVELGKDELEMVTGGAGLPEFCLVDDSFDAWIKWGQK